MFVYNVNCEASRKKLKILWNDLENTEKRWLFFGIEVFLVIFVHHLRSSLLKRH